MSPPPPFQVASVCGCNRMFKFGIFGKMLYLCRPMETYSRHLPLRAAQA